MTNQVSGEQPDGDSLRFNTSEISYGDFCYVPKKEGTETYGYARVIGVSDDWLGLELEGGGYLHLTPREGKLQGIIWTHKEEHFATVKDS